jgi:hypothetical protein
MNQFLDTKYFVVYSEIICALYSCLQRLKMFFITASDRMQEIFPVLILLSSLKSASLEYTN